MQAKIKYLLFYGLGLIFNYFVQGVQSQNNAFIKALLYAIAYGVLSGLTKKLKINLQEYLFLVAGLVTGGILLIYLFGFTWWYIIIVVVALDIGFHTKVLLKKSNKTKINK